MALQYSIKLVPNIARAHVASNPVNITYSELRIETVEKDVKYIHC